MESKFYFTDQRVLIKIPQILNIINIIDNDFEYLLLLKFKLYVEALNPGWVKVVHDDLRQANHLPHPTLLLINDGEPVSSCKCVQVWQILTCEGQS